MSKGWDRWAPSRGDPTAFTSSAPGLCYI
jgi:hypothetical protein